MQACRYHAWPIQAWRTIGTASANLMMSRVLACKTTQSQDEYTAATASLFRDVDLSPIVSSPCDIKPLVPDAETPLSRLAVRSLEHDWHCIGAP